MNMDAYYGLQILTNMATPFLLVLIFWTLTDIQSELFKLRLK